MDAEPSDAMLTRVVVTSAGKDLVDAPDFRVSRIELFRLFAGLSSKEAEESGVIGVVDLAAEMLSRATSVIGAALGTPVTDGQFPGYQFYFSISW